MDLDAIGKALFVGYRTNVQPLEVACDFHVIYSPALRESDFNARRLILLIGPRSSGKTPFLKAFTEKPLKTTPGLKEILFITHGNSDQNPLEGTKAVSSGKLGRLKGISKFGLGILRKVKVHVFDSPNLKEVDLVEFPGLPWGPDVSKKHGAFHELPLVYWLGLKADRIFMFFDVRSIPESLSPQVIKMIQALRFSGDRVSVVFTRAEDMKVAEMLNRMATVQSLVSRHLDTSNPIPIYLTGRKRLENPFTSRIFSHKDLIFDASHGKLLHLLRMANVLEDRGNLAKSQAYINDIFHRSIQAEGSRAEKDMAWLENLYDLNRTFIRLQRERSVKETNFPNLEYLWDKLLYFDPSQLKPLDESALRRSDEFLVSDLQKLRKQILELLAKKAQLLNLSPKRGTFQFESAPSARIPEFTSDYNSRWALQPFLEQYGRIFKECKPKDGKLTLTQGKNAINAYKLPQFVAERIWRKSDLDKDGRLDKEEFALALHLMLRRTHNLDIPNRLPVHLIPMSKRFLYGTPGESLDTRTLLQKPEYPNISLLEPTTWEEAPLQMPEVDLKSHAFQVAERAEALVKRRLAALKAIMTDFNVEPEEPEITISEVSPISSSATAAEMSATVPSVSGATISLTVPSNSETLKGTKSNSTTETTGFKQNVLPTETLSGILEILETSESISINAPTATASSQDLPKTMEKPSEASSSVSQKVV
ncbi:unnamed protein product [Darwinula stevensoni]|uniref:Uncharacterized protein n=1 Tax=Darwinula stevensoni TaxID=69355 RepID=A0A7R8X2X1_9CRUS|nr:unnamed protein product [Darwinula stevensoni]CAG0881725.1 unnamed protein product [Darwinula stevensoni]